MLLFLLLPLVIVVVHASSTFSIRYPSAIPTINYIDDVVFEWATSFNNTEVDLNCGFPGVSPLIMQSPAAVDRDTPITTQRLFDLGKVFHNFDDYPITCIVSMTVAGDENVSIDGGKFVVTLKAGQNPRQFAAQTTSIVSTRSSSTSSPTSVKSTSSTSTSSNSSTQVTSTTQGSTLSQVITQPPSSSSLPTTASNLQSDPNSTSTSTPSSALGLSTAATAGIAVGSAVGGIAVFALIGVCIMLFLRHKAAKKAQRNEAAKENVENFLEPGRPKSTLLGSDNVTGLGNGEKKDGNDGMAGPAELGSQRQHHELDGAIPGNPTLHELA